jgi:hypothetical protein
VNSSSISERRSSPSTGSWRALRVEYAIVGLIVFEILLTLLQWWLSGLG